MLCWLDSIGLWLSVNLISFHSWSLLSSLSLSSFLSFSFICSLFPTDSLPIPQILHFSISKAPYNPFSSCYAYKVSWVLNNTSSGRILSQTLAFSSVGEVDGSIDLDESFSSYVLGSDILSDSKSNYTIILDIEFELQNKTIYNVTQVSSLSTPSCNSSMLMYFVTQRAMNYFVT